MLFRVVYILLITALFSISIGAQTVGVQNAGAQIKGRSASEEDDKDPLGSPQNELLVRNEIKHAEKLHQENIERARQALELTFKVRDAFKDTQTLGQSDRKNLERLEKLVRRIRSSAGGSSGDGDETVVPLDPSVAIARLAETAEAVQTGVEKTPRQVVSAAVIKRTNEFLQLIHYLRAATR